MLVGLKMAVTDFAPKALPGVNVNLTCVDSRCKDIPAFNAMNRLADEQAGRKGQKKRCCCCYLAAAADSAADTTVFGGRASKNQPNMVSALHTHQVRRSGKAAVCGRASHTVQHALYCAATLHANIPSSMLLLLPPMLRLLLLLQSLQLE